MLQTQTSLLVNYQWLGVRLSNLNALPLQKILISHQQKVIFSGLCHFKMWNLLITATYQYLKVLYYSTFFFKSYTIYIFIYLFTKRLWFLLGFLSVMELPWLCWPACVVFVCSVHWNSAAITTVESREESTYDNEPDIARKLRTCECSVQSAEMHSRLALAQVWCMSAIWGC